METSRGPIKLTFRLLHINSYCSLKCLTLHEKSKNTNLCKIFFLITKKRDYYGFL